MQAFLKGNLKSPQLLTKKKSHPKSLELCFSQWTILGLKAETQHLK